MRLFLLLLLLAVPAAPQVAQEANREYLTKEGRERMGRNLAEAGRDRKEKPDEIIADMNIQPGMTVADIGSGVGYMLSRLSAATGPRGKVIAEDIFPDFLDKCRALSADNKLPNIDFILGSEKDPRLPAASVDVALLLEVYHHFNYPVEMLAGLRASLKPNGKLVIVDFHRSYGEKHIRLDEDAVIQEVESNGFHLVSKREHPSDNQYMAVFERNKAPVLPSKK